MLHLSFRQVRRQRRRYWGVTAALALGTAGFVVISTMGSDFKESLNRDLNLIGGVTIIKVYYDNDSGSRPKWFHYRTRKAVEHIQGVEKTSLVSVRYNIPSIKRDHTYHFNLVAVDEFFWKVNGFSPAAGEFFSVRSVAMRERICVLGVALEERIFSRGKGVGQYLIIDRDYYRVVGVLGGLGAGGLTRFAFIPLTTAMNRVSRLPPPGRMYVRCRTWDDVEPVAARIRSMVAQYQDPQGLRIEVATEQLKRVRMAAWWVELFVIVSIAATLILGGCGIWNGMTASVRARTREIGLKKALGAEDGDILVQILGEALCLSTGSALFGVLMGRGAIEIAGFFLENRPSESLFLTSAGLALLIAIVLGVTAGLFPAIRASRMQVAAAIHYE
ncbi:MAG: ABC transporter permease [Deltaproteobacteria bacterium]|nr:ABC transporter permease [Deltaproteobacteria bacterium]